MPRVSVIVPTHNRLRHLRVALDSVFAQSFDDYELIVVDDGSTDETGPYLAGLGDRVRVIHIEHQGAAVARNRGAAEATGSWLAFLDSDDTWTANSLAVRLARADAEPDADLFFSDARIVFDDRDVGRTVAAGRTPHVGSVTGALIAENFLCTSTVLIKKGTFDRAGGFRTECEPAEDYDLWLSISRDARFGYERAALANYRVHAGSIGADRTRMFGAEIRVLEEFTGRWGMTKTSAVRMRMARLYYFLGVLELTVDPASARRHFLSSARWRPPAPKALAMAAMTGWPSLLERSARRFLDKLELY